MEDPTLLIPLLFTSHVLIIMFARLAAKQLLFRRFDNGDYFSMGAILRCAARGALKYVVLTWGSNNLSPEARAKVDFTDQEIHHRTIRSQMVISNRPIYNTYLWLQKLVLMDFCVYHYCPEKKRKHRIWWAYRSVFFVAWPVSQVVGFTKCDPFHLYWQGVPAPGKCVEAQVQLTTLGVTNIVTDLMLFALPLPTLISLNTPWRTKIRLYIFCTLGLFIVAITVIRLPFNAQNAAVQSNRTTWATTELLTAGLVVKAPTLYGAMIRWKRKRQGESYGTGRDSATAASATRTSNQYPLSGKSTPRSKDEEEEDEIALYPIQHLGYNPARSPASGAASTRGVAL